jgi:hypothetical protein
MPIVTKRHTGSQLTSRPPDLLGGIAVQFVPELFKRRRIVAVKHAIAAYRGEMDFIQQWLDEQTVVDPQGKIPRSMAYGAYKSWSENEHAPTLGNRRFVEELHGRGFPTAKSNGARSFRGLRLGSAGATLRVVGGTSASP